MAPDTPGPKPPKPPRTDLVGRPRSLVPPDLPVPKPLKPPRTYGRPRSAAPPVADTLKRVLSSREVRRKFFVFSLNNYFVENYLFYFCVEQYRNGPNQQKAFCLFHTFIVAGSSFEVNLPSTMRNIRQGVLAGAPAVFDEAQGEMLTVLGTTMSSSRPFAPGQPAPQITQVETWQQVLVLKNTFTETGFDLEDLGVW